MTSANFTSVGLRLQLWLGRCGWSNSIAAVLLAIAGLAWLWAWPLDGQLNGHRIALRAAQQALLSPMQIADTPPLPPAAQHLQQFHDALGESRYAEQQIKTLFVLAAKNGLTLNQADYKYADNKSGAFHSYTVTLPVKGSYAAIRAFCQQVLLAIPFASLDEINFKRDNVTTPLLDTKLRFTLYLDNTSEMHHLAQDTAPGSME